MSAAPITTDQWLAAAKTRRTVYFPAGTSKVSDERVEEILKEVLSFAPSSFNAQTSRITLVVGDKHKELYEIALKEAKAALLRRSFEGLSNFIGAHGKAYGSLTTSPAPQVIFWESEEANNKLVKERPSIAPLANTYSEHTSAIHQILVWTALELEGLGGNLQHMQAFPAIESGWRKLLELPEDYKLKASINYGDADVNSPPPEKLPFSETLKVVK